MKTLRLLCLALVTALALTTSHAATYTWTGAGFFGNQDFLWSNPYNWQGLAAPQNGEVGVQLVFPNTAAPRNTTNDVLNLGISSVTFFGANYAVHGGASGSTMTLIGSGGSGYAILAAANNCQFGANTRLHFGSEGGIAVPTGNTFTLKSRLSGVYGFTKSSPGTLSLQTTNASTFFGVAKVLDGMLDLSSPALAISGSLVVGDGDSGEHPIARLTLNNQIGDSSAVTVDANGQLWLNGHNDTVGSLTVMDGGWVNTGIGDTAASPGLLSLNGNVTNRYAPSFFVGGISGQLYLGASQRVFHIENWLDVDANISDSAIWSPGFTIVGGGLLDLSGRTNTYTGPTYVQNGVLRLSQNSQPGATNSGTFTSPMGTVLLDHTVVGKEALSLNGSATNYAVRYDGTNSWAGPITVAGQCVVDTDSVGGTPSDELTLAGNISGTGAIHKTGHGVLRFTGLGNNTFTGGFYGEDGETVFEKSASAQALGGPLFVGRADDDFPRAFVKVGTLNQIPNSSLVTLRNSGALRIENGASDTLGDVVFEGGWLDAMEGTFTLSGNVTNHISPDNISALHGDIVLPAGEHVFHCEWLSQLEVPGVLRGAGGITMRGDNGMLTLFNANTYAGLTHVAEGTLRLEGLGRPGSSAAGTVIDGLASLQLRYVSITNETLQLDPLSVYTPIIHVFGTNIWKGPVVLNTNADIRSFSLSHLAFDGPISGPGGIVYRGDDWNALDGTLVLQGDSDNTYQGETQMLEGALLLNKVNATAIPGDLVIGHETNGAPAASVYCQRNSQFASVTVDNVNMLRVTVNGSGGLHCGGYLQFIANLLTRGGSVFTEGGTLYLHNAWNAETNASASHFFGTLRLASPFNNHTHVINVDSNASLLVWGDIGQGISVANVEKQGKGELAMISSNSFDGVFTISDGRVLASGVKPFGTEAGRTIVGYGATLVAYGGTNAEPFTLSGRGYMSQGALVIPGSNYFNGPILLAANADIVTPVPTNLAVFSGAISGPGGLTKLGQGIVRLAGSDDNTYMSATKVNEGALELAKTNANAIRGALDIGLAGGDALVRYLHDEQLSELTPVNIGDSGQLRLLGHNDTIGSLAGFGIVELLDGSLITGHDNTATTYAGVISGIGGNVTKTGTNTFTLAGDNAYTGATFAKGGTLLVRGQQPWSDVTIQTGGTLGGTGTVGAISDLSGHVKPGMNTYGILKCAGFATHSPANQFQIEINGTAPGVNCDQLDVTGNVLLMGGTLHVAMNYSGAVSNEYVIVKNNGTNPVTGSFVSLPQDAVLTANGVAFQITYHGGDGNDIALIQQNLAGVGPQLGGVKKLNDGTIEITATGIPNAKYAVEATEDLSTPVQWTDIGPATADAQGAITFLDADAVNHLVRFYRFRYEP